MQKSLFTQMALSSSEIQRLHCVHQFYWDVTEGMCIQAGMGINQDIKLGTHYSCFWLVKMAHWPVNTGVQNDTRLRAVNTAREHG